MNVQEEEIVISGISGKFPECDNIEEFCEKLYAGTDMTSDAEKRFPMKYYNLSGMAYLKDLTKFDTDFFSITGIESEVMDPQMKMLLELSYEAIIDSGTNPMCLKGSNTAVYVGKSNDESIEFLSKYNNEDVMPHYATGNASSMFANRISYTFDFKGPSMTIDTACSSSMTALCEAFLNIKTGICDRALVAGSRLCMMPYVSSQFSALKMLSMKGKSRPFDESGDGYVRAESICVIMIERKSLAKRVYATLLNIGANSDGNTVHGILRPSADMQEILMERVYKEAGINCHEIEYLEAHATGTTVGDSEEINAAANFLCKDKKEPLLIGSVKSNMGHSEPASGLCGMAKIILAMERGQISPTINFETPNKYIPALADGRMKVVVEPTIYKGGLIALNNFGFGGSNVHAVLKPNDKAPSKKIKTISKLVMVSGRTEASVKHYLKKLEKLNNDDLLGLVRNIHKTNIKGHPYRGYCIFDTDEPVMNIQKSDQQEHQIWFIVTGLGSQWPGMGKDLMEIKVFRESVIKCSAVLEPYGMLFYDMINKGKNELLNKEHLLIAITIIQISMVDLLKSVGIEANGVIGHSNGEIVAAYIDEALTLEQAVLCTYFKVRSVLEVNSTPGSMASVGLSWSEAVKHCPAGVYAVCDNSSNNVTVSGPPELLQEFMKVLQDQNIFVREVSNNMKAAFHSKYIEESGILYKKYLETIILDPKRRSSRWVSTSIPTKEWDSKLAQTCSVDYLVNNMVSPVLFREAMNFIPENAIVIEIGPHCMFQTILKSSLPSTCTIIGLSKKFYPSNVDLILSSIGKMYNIGLQPDIETLYPKIEFPVPRGTPMLSPLVEWDHLKSWRTNFYTESFYGAAKFSYIIETTSERSKFLKGHVINDRTVYPATGYLFLLWKSFSKMIFEPMNELSVMLQDVRFHRATILPEKDRIIFQVDICTISGDFELRESGSLVVSGKIVKVVDPQSMIMDSQLAESTNMHMYSNDVYKILRLCGYGHSGIFKGIQRSDTEGINGEIQWNNNWIAFSDTLLQFYILSNSAKRLLYVPTTIDRIVIDPKKIYSLQPDEKVPIHVDKDLGVIKTVGIEIRGVGVNAILRSASHPPPKLERHEFVPHVYIKDNNQALNLKKNDILNIVQQIILENIEGHTLKILELPGKKRPCDLNSTSLGNILKDVPLAYVDITVVTDDSEEYSKDEVLKLLGAKFVTSNDTSSLQNENLHLLIASNILSQEGADIFFLKIANILPNKAFILLEEASDFAEFDSINGWKKICFYETMKNKIILLRRAAQYSNFNVVYLTEENFNWMDDLKLAFKESENDGRKTIIIDQKTKISGIVGMVKCLKEEPGGENLRCFFIEDEKAPSFSLDIPFYADQLEKDLLMNVYRNSSWGSFNHLDLEPVTTKYAEHAHIDILTPGNLNTLQWIQSPRSNDSSLCHVYYSALNFRDVMLASGRLPITGEGPLKERSLGLEFAGRDLNGQRVFGIVKNFGMSTTLVPNPSTMLLIPEHWTMEQAVTVPIAYITVYYSLIVRAQMIKGETILIHAGSGGVGIPAITIALHMGMIVYTTVGSQEKRDFLKKRFPQLTDRHIANSRDVSFEKNVLKETNGLGVDIVLNSLSEEKLQASLRCLAHSGRFVEIGKYDIVNNSKLGMSAFMKNISYHGIEIYDMLGAFDKKLRLTMKLLENGIKSGEVQPLPATIFSEGNVSKAFKFLGSAKHIGKVVLKIRDEEDVNIMKPEKKLVFATPRIHFNSNEVYIIIGGLGGMGLELANWLVSRGAKNIVLTSRTGVRNGYDTHCIKNWESQNVTVTISTEDCAQEEGVIKLIKQSNNLGRVAGIFNLAGILRDFSFENMTQDDFVACCIPKIKITTHLDNVSRQLCPHLEHFVVFSSVSCGRGNPGQSNYGYANSVMERICEERHKLQLPALAIQWGLVHDTGLFFKRSEGKLKEIRGVQPQRISSCFSTFDTFLITPYPVVSSMVVADKTIVSSTDDINILDIIGDLLNITNIKDMSPNTTITQLGADSFMVTAIKQALERDYSMMLSLQEIRDLTLAKLQTLKNFTENKTQEIDTSQLVKTKIVTDVPDDWLPTNVPTEVLLKLSPQNLTLERNVNVFIIHPIQGTVGMLKPLASSLPAHVWGLQCTTEAPCDSVSDLAAFYLKHIQMKQPKGPYILSAYSLGTVICFEIALQLEKIGESVTMVLIDGATDKNLYEEIVFQKLRIKNIDVGNISIFLYLQNCGYENLILFETELVTVKSLEERFSLMSEIIHKDLGIPVTQVKEAALLFYRRMNACFNYSPTIRFSGECVLIKSITTKDILTPLTFNKLFKEEVEIVDLNGTHENIMKDEELLQKIRDIFIQFIYRFK